MAAVADECAAAASFACFVMRWKSLLTKSTYSSSSTLSVHMSATEIRPSTYWRHEIVPSTSSASSSQSSSAASAASSSVSSAASALVIRRWTKQYSVLAHPLLRPLAERGPELHRRRTQFGRLLDQLALRLHLVGVEARVALEVVALVALEVERVQVLRVVRELDPPLGLGVGHGAARS